MPYAAGELRAQIATEERGVPFVLVSIGTTGHTVQVTKKNCADMRTGRRQELLKPWQPHVASQRAAISRPPGCHRIHDLR